ncbi:MAG: PEP/pyruvate-binding domain-containing protein [Candidatus Nanohaloarchaea archaeon]
MVQWKDQLEGETGSKAAALEELENLSVPNFFVVTRSEAAEGFSSTDDGLKVSEQLENSIMEAYQDIGMSSEVRNSNGRAKNLVGGQRNNQLVSVRISERGDHEYKLNVGSSELIDAVESVASSYYRSAEEEHPAIIIQKMVEPGYTGAMLGSRGRALLEAVEGLGTSLEEGITSPHYYVLEKGEVTRKHRAENQLKIKRNPINGKHKREQVTPETLPFEEEEVTQLHSKLASEGVNAKFVYKRGSFHIVDAWKASEEFQANEEGIRVSDGEIRGEIGRDVSYTDKTLPPDEYHNALIARKGGYTSRDAEKAREAGKPAIFSFNRELKNGQQVSIERGQISPGIEDRETGQPFNNSEKARRKGRDTASEVIPLNPGRRRGLHLSPPYGRGFNVAARDAPGELIPANGYLQEYGDVFAFDGEKAVLDARKLGERGLGEAMSYLDAETKILVLPGPDRKIIRAGISNGFEVFAAPGQALEQVREAVAAEEQRFIIRKLREI